MHLKTGSLDKYPYISYNDYKTEALKFQSDNSTDLIWNTKCSLRCKINNQEIVIPSNSIILLDRGSSFSCKDDNLVQVKILRFNTEIFSDSLVFICGFINTSARENLKNNTILLFENEQIPVIENIFLTIEQILKERSSLNIKKMKAAIFKLLQNALKDKFANDARYINRFGEILNSQFSILHNVSGYALQLNMAPKNLLRKFQKQGLKNPSEIIKEKLLLEIKEMIIYTDKSIREICFEIGFYDPAYFSRFFKKHVGVTAQCFRRHYASGLSEVEMENSTM